MKGEFIHIDTIKEIAELKNRIKQAINKLYECGEVLDPLFQRDMLDILNGTNKYSIFDTYCKKYKRIELEDLNEEIKFLEEDKKIEKLKITDDKYIYNPTVNSYNKPTNWGYTLANKINEIIDKIEELDNEKNGNT